MSWFSLSHQNDLGFVVYVVVEVRHAVLEEITLLQDEVHWEKMIGI